MKTIICGSRHFADEALMKRVLSRTRFEITEVVCGMAKGADIMGAEWAKENGVPVKEFPADWKSYGRAAGPKRNKQMADYGEACVAFMYPGSRGTANMVKQFEKKKQPLIVVDCEVGIWIEYNMNEGYF